MALSDARFCQIYVETWEEAMDLGRGLVTHVFRGQADTNWLLSPSLERAANRYGFPSDSLRNREVILLRNFQRQAHHYIDSPPQKDELFEWLALMQHHGAPTRLIDFSKSFYVAAFFAMETADQDAALWALGSDFANFHTNVVPDREGTLFDLEDESCSVFSEYLDGRRSDNCVMLVEPFRRNQRLAVQQGCFIAPGDLKQTFMQNLASFLKLPVSAFRTEKVRRFKRKDLVQLMEIPVVKIVLPASIHNAAMWDLDNMNVSATTLFAGLDGFARSMHTWFRDVI